MKTLKDVMATVVFLSVCTGAIWVGVRGLRLEADKATRDAQWHVESGQACVQNELAVIQGTDYRAEQRRLDALIACATRHPGTIETQTIIRQLAIVNARLVTWADSVGR